MEKTNLNLANKIEFIDAQVYYEDGQPYLYYTGVFDNGLEVEIPKINLNSIQVHIKREEGLYSNSVECRISFDNQEENFFMKCKDIKKYETGQEIKVDFGEGSIYKVSIGKIKMMSSLDGLKPEFHYELILPNGASLSFWREEAIEEMEVK